MQSGYRLENGKSVTVETKTDNYTLTPEDNGRMIVVTAGVAKTVTVPANLPVGFNCIVKQGGAGTLTIEDDGTTSIVNVDSQFDTGGQYACVTLFSDAPDEFTLAGRTA